MKKSESYRGPWPRKRHSHTCVTCKRDRSQGAVACYKSKCTLPQTIDTCACCRPVQPSVTYRPPAPADDGGRNRMGNTPTCGDCGESLDHCTCGDESTAAQHHHHPACGFLRSAKNQTACDCSKLRLAEQLKAAGLAPAAAADSQAPAAQLDLFGGAQ